jgi:hypothetical protein
MVTFGESKTPQREQKILGGITIFQNRTDDHMRKGKKDAMVVGV